MFVVSQISKNITNHVYYETYYMSSPFVRRCIWKICCHGTLCCW